jgi:hypothetical protein
MLRRELIVVLMALVIFWAAPVAAASGDERTQNAPKANSGTGKRVMWTIIGAAAGFGAGVYFGLNQFDDAVNSDQKVWMSALAFAAAGGVTANLLSRNVGSAQPEVRKSGSSEVRRQAVPDTSWNAAVSGTSLLTPPRR